MADELLNCPFCGSQAAWPEPEVNMNYVQCMSCSATANHAGEWNRRTPPTPGTDAREAVAQALYDHESPNSALAWEHKPAHFQENVRRFADAAILALTPFIAASIRTPPTPATDEREAVARAINPDVWASFDGSIRPYAENRGANASTDSAHFYERTWRAGCRTPDDVRRWWLETADAAKESTYVLLLRNSLTKADAALSDLTPIRAQEIAAARAEEQGYRHTQVAALNQVHAAEILAAEANERARIATYLNMRAEQWRDLAVAHSGDALKWADCSARENELLRQAIAIEPNEHGAGK